MKEQEKKQPSVMAKTHPVFPNTTEDLPLALQIFFLWLVGRRFDPQVHDAFRSEYKPLRSIVMRVCKSWYGGIVGLETNQGKQYLQKYLLGETDSSGGPRYCQGEIAQFVESLSWPQLQKCIEQRSVHVQTVYDFFLVHSEQLNIAPSSPKKFELAFLCEEIFSTYYKWVSALQAGLSPEQMDSGGNFFGGIASGLRALAQNTRSSNNWLGSVKRSMFGLFGKQVEVEITEEQKLWKRLRELLHDYQQYALELGFNFMTRRVAEQHIQVWVLGKNPLDLKALLKKQSMVWLFPKEKFDLSAAMTEWNLGLFLFGAEQRTTYPKRLESVFAAVLSCLKEVQSLAEWNSALRSLGQAWVNTTQLTTCQQNWVFAQAKKLHADLLDKIVGIVRNAEDFNLLMESGNFFWNKEQIAELQNQLPTEFFPALKSGETEHEEEGQQEAEFSFSPRSP